MIVINIKKTKRQLDNYFKSKYFINVERAEKYFAYRDSWLKIADFYHALLMRSNRDQLVLLNENERNEIVEMLGREIKSAEVFNHLKSLLWIQDLKDTLKELKHAPNSPTQENMFDGIPISQLKITKKETAHEEDVPNPTDNPNTDEFF